jgi:hypothetical protein
MYSSIARAVAATLADENVVSPVAVIVDGGLIPSLFDVDVDRHVRRRVEDRAGRSKAATRGAARWTSASSSI